MLEQIKSEQLTFGLLCVVTIWGSIKWLLEYFARRKMWEGNRDLAKEVEKLKDEYVKKQTVHNIAFDTRFTLYKEIWATIYKLQSASNIMPILDHLPLDHGEREKEYERRSKAAEEEFQNALSVLELKKPFYPTKIYELARQLSRDCLSHIIRIRSLTERSRFDQKKMNECYKMTKAFVDDNKEKIDEIEGEIRKDIRS